MNEVLEKEYMIYTYDSGYKNRWSDREIKKFVLMKIKNRSNECIAEVINKPLESIERRSKLFELSNIILKSKYNGLFGKVEIYMHEYYSLLRKNESSLYDLINKK
jgi:predicted nuclease of predicted toxin-antitoxin system